MLKPLRGHVICNWCCDDDPDKYQLQKVFVQHNDDAAHTCTKHPAHTQLFFALLDRKRGESKQAETGNKHRHHGKNIYKLRCHLFVAVSRFKLLVEESICKRVFRIEFLIDAHHTFERLLCFTWL